MSGTGWLTAGDKLYFLHLARTGGSSLTRVLEDVFPAGSRWPGDGVDGFLASPARALTEHRLFCGHLGTLPFDALGTTLRAVSLLRDPVERAWSHFHAARRVHRTVARRFPPSDDGFADFVTDERYRWVTADFQAHWLACTPTHDVREPAAPGLALAAPFGPDRRPLPDDELLDRARATLGRCDVIGTTDRLDDVVRVLAARLGCWLPAPPRLNGDAAGRAVSPDMARLVAERSQVDAALVELARRRIDQLVAAAPHPSAEPAGRLPFVLTMDDGLQGAGWHGRVRDELHGAHRWSGPEPTACIRLPVRLHGDAHLSIAVPAFAGCVRPQDVAISVQGRALAHRTRRAGAGWTLEGRCSLRRDEPVIVQLSVPRTCPLEEGGEPAGLAVSRLELVPDEAS